MSLYFGDTEITNIDNLVPQTGLDITDLWFGSTNVYTVWQTYEGTLPATIISTGANMRQYQIFGNAGGVGEEVNITGLSEPLCGIGTYTDSLDLSTGLLTRRIKKLVLTGAETDWRAAGEGSTRLYNHTIGTGISYSSEALCNVAKYSDSVTTSSGVAFDVVTYQGVLVIRFHAIEYATLNNFKSYLATQYAAGTPVTVWYVLAEPEVSTITVPPGLTGTIEGYLIQDGTPTPETPIYPTANGVKQADDTYSIKYGYKLDMGVKSGNFFTRTGETKGIYLGIGGNEKTIAGWSASAYIPVSPNETYIFVPNSTGANDAKHIMYDANYVQVGYVASGQQTFTTTADTGYMRFSYRSASSNITLTEGTTPPDKYQPYSNTITPIYIGDEPLEEDEYVDYQEQKVYRMIDGTLTPTDPPVPLPALPTCEGETVVDYAGSGTAPEKVLLKYRKEGY